MLPLVVLRSAGLEDLGFRDYFCSVDHVPLQSLQKVFFTSKDLNHFGLVVCYGFLISRARARFAGSG